MGAPEVQLRSGLSASLLEPNRLPNYWLKATTASKWMSNTIVAIIHKKYTQYAASPKSFAELENQSVELKAFPREPLSQTNEKHYSRRFAQSAGPGKESGVFQEKCKNTIAHNQWSETSCAKARYRKIVTLLKSFFELLVSSESLFGVTFSSRRRFGSILGYC